RRPRQCADPGACGRGSGMETPRRAAGICAAFCAAQTTSDQSVAAGNPNDGAIAENQFLCDDRTGFWNFVLCVLPQISVWRARPGLLARRAFTNQPPP